MNDPAPTAVRGHVVTVVGDPFRHRDDEVLVEFEDGLVVVEDGRIAAVGSFADLGRTLPADAVVDHYPGAIISAGFVDTHVHYVQTGIIAAFGAQLIDWLNEYTFIEEQRFSDPAHAEHVARVFFDQLLANGTTTALTFCAVYPASVDAFFAEAARRNMLMVGGKVLMDRNAPTGLLDTAERGYEESKALIERWHGVGRSQYAITPRFAPTSTEAQLDAAATLHREFPTTLVQTHISENLGEIAWVRSLFPDRSGYLDVYDHAGLLGAGTVLAHGVHLTAAERLRCAESGTAISHCPTSNLFLGSGLFHIHQAKSGPHPMKVGLGTDIGAGTSFSLLSTMNEAYKVAQMTQYPLDAVKMFYLATLGGAEALGLEDRIGSVEVGKDADLVVLDTQATDLLRFRRQTVDSLDEQLFVLSVMADDRAVAATYIAGRLAHRRDDGPTPTTHTNDER
ncbi:MULTISPECIES: guanine deaminase [unclassified Curtobacterium]|uniref:guanine deaminase n=1 Tax=unclassified Curtobacterium TaxID=257496 RepID=UPI001045806B|nr:MULTISPECIES: guanine deaminase [unclassified Curtobacterium]TCU51036.1 guanine deaminase [Curtobacterium sp. PhB146]TCU86708.1 guanine deaminase [Curtobacterium sp. PhB191]